MNYSMYLEFATTRQKNIFFKHFRLGDWTEAVYEKIERKFKKILRVGVYIVQSYLFSVQYKNSRIIIFEILERKQNNEF